MLPVTLQSRTYVRESAQEELNLRLAVISRVFCR